MISFISFLLVSLLFLTTALGVPLNKRDVVDPPVTTPNKSTVWTAGSSQMVVWDTSKLPPYNQITNQVGTVVLGFLDSNGENLMIDKPLAKGFNITQGSVQVIVPIVPTRSNYIIVLMGDSGNASPMFTIISDAPSLSLVGGSTVLATPTNPPPTTDGTTPTSSSSPTGETTFGSESSAITPSSTSGSSASTASSSLSLTTVVTATSSGAIQATATSSNGATSLHRSGATCFGAVLILALLLL